MLKHMKQAVAVAVLGVTGVLSAPLAMAQTAAVDYSEITTAVNWADVAQSVITIFAAGALVIVAFVGGKFLLRAIRGA